MNKSEQIQAAKDLAKKKVKLPKTNVLGEQIKLIKKFAKSEAKSRGKTARDVQDVINLVSEIKEGETLHIISNKIDSPNIMRAFEPESLKAVFIATWAVTEPGLIQLKKISDAGVNVSVLMDTTYSYKWAFESGAIGSFKDNARFYFSRTHMKMQMYEFINGSVLGFIGSMNLSNNPRFENMFITKDKEVFFFYLNTIKDIAAGKFNEQQRMF